MLLQFHYAGAVGVLEKTIPLIGRLEERALVVSALAWAAGAAGWNTRRLEAERSALELVATHDDYAPGVFIHLADSCRAAGDWNRALEFIVQAQDFALARQEPGLAQVALTLRAAIKRRERHPPQAPDTDASGALLRSILVRLGKRRAPGHGSE